MIALLIYSSVSIAHPGGHYHGEGAFLNNWQLKNGKVIKGNFSMGKDNFILLEQLNGDLVKVPIENLSEQDQLLARFKIKKYKQLNIGAVKVSNSTTQINPSTNYYLFFILILMVVAIFLISKKIYQLFSEAIQNRTKWLLISSYFLLLSLIGFACKKTTDTISSSSSTSSSSSIPKTTTGFIDSAFAPNKPSVSTRWDDTYFYVASNGMPAHNMMVGITNWQQQVPIPQFYTGTNSWAIPLQPVYASVPLSTKTNFMKGAVALAVNGIPIFNALNNRGEDSYLIGELDNWGGHCGRGDDYHYHSAPLHLSTTSGLNPIAFALDGFPVYGSKEPDGSVMSTLDSCHGHVGTNNIYHYHGTTNYPYVVGAMKGKVNLDPTTTAPENQILPQAFTKAVRPATNPLRGASITDFTAVGTNGYQLTYKISTKTGYIKYSWDLNNKYTYILTDTGGIATTTSYQR